MRTMRYNSMNILREIMFILKGSKCTAFLSMLIYAFSAFCAIYYISELNGLYEKVALMRLDGTLIASFIMVGGLILINDILNAVSNYISDKHALQIEKDYMELIFQKTAELSAEDYQNPSVLDLITSIKNGKEMSVEFILHAEIAVSYHIIYYIFVMMYIYSIHWLLALCILVTYMPSLITYYMKKKIAKDSEEESVIFRRQMDAYYSYIVKNKHCKETRFFKLENFFKEKFRNSSDKYEQIRLFHFKKKTRMDFVANLTYVIGLMVMLATLMVLVQTKSITVAEVATVITIVLSVYESMNEFVNFHIAGMLESIVALQKLIELNELYAKQGEEHLEGEGYHIDLENVSFAYPHTDKLVLNDLNLRVKNKETIAIVGENGSGKTTLAKIIAGLYRPSGGMMYINGQNRNILSNQEILERITVVFQDFNKYPLGIGENITISDTKKNVDVKRMENLAKSVGIYGKAMDEENGFETLLAKEFGGSEWSGGLWQRLAIARAGYKEAEIVVFDEPTAAIDPLEEIDIMKKLIKICEQKTAVLVTHRIGAAKLADRIVVMDNGKICEEGTHDELLKNRGKYYTFYEKQKEWYL